VVRQPLGDRVGWVLPPQVDALPAVVEALDVLGEVADGWRDLDGERDVGGGDGRVEELLRKVEVEEGRAGHSRDELVNEVVEASAGGDGRVQEALDEAGAVERAGEEGENRVGEALVPLARRKQRRGDHGVGRGAVAGSEEVRARHDVQPVVLPPGGDASEARHEVEERAPEAAVLQGGHVLNAVAKQVEVFQVGQQRRVRRQLPLGEGLAIVEEGLQRVDDQRPHAR